VTCGVADILFLGGKSAVLSGLTVALGGKATSTGRGSGLKSFIKEGETYVTSLCRKPSPDIGFFSWAEATIKIKNEGSEAYKPEVYGPSIIITRRIVKDGSASYKIKNHKDKVVSSKKEDLSAVLDHMGIQVSYRSIYERSSCSLIFCPGR
jgi:chromosome segregation ATPase